MFAYAYVNKNFIIFASGKKGNLQGSAVMLGFVFYKRSEKRVMVLLDLSFP
jgi:hypothetical protein